MGRVLTVVLFVALCGHSCIHGAASATITPAWLNLPVANKLLTQQQGTACGDAFYILGGRNSSGEYGQVYRFETLMGRWEELHPMPDKITLHDGVAACVGDIMYVIGGTSTGSSISWNMRFNVSSLQWLSPGHDLPSNISRAAVAVASNYIYVMGGCQLVQSKTQSYSNKMYRYSVRDNSWEKMHDLTVSYRSSAAAVYGDNIYLFGGEGSDGEATKYVGRYSISKDTWTDLPSSAQPPAALSFTQAATYGRHILVLGSGHTDEASNAVRVFVPDSETFNSSSALPLMLSAGGYLAATMNNDVFAVGNAQTTRTQALRLFATPTLKGSWKTVPKLNITFPFSTMLVHQHKLFALGGGESRVEVWSFSYGDFVWRQLSDYPAALVNFRCGAWNQTIVCFGGGVENCGKSPTSSSKTVMIYNITSDTWTSGKDMDVGRLKPMVVTVGHFMYVAGGMSNCNVGNAPNVWTTSTDSVKKFNAESLEWVEGCCASMKQPTTAGGHVEFGGYIWIFGGYSDKSNSGGTNTIQWYDLIFDTWGLESLFSDKPFQLTAIPVGGTIQLVGGYIKTDVPVTAVTSFQPVFVAGSHPNAPTPSSIPDTPKPCYPDAVGASSNSGWGLACLFQSDDDAMGLQYFTSPCTGDSCTIYVNPSFEHQFRACGDINLPCLSLGDALGVVQSGASIILLPGTYSGPENSKLEIPSFLGNITIRAMHDSSVFWSGDIRPVITVYPFATLTIHGVIFSASQGAVLTAAASTSIRITACVFAGCSILQEDAIVMGANSILSISDCKFVSDLGAGLYMGGTLDTIGRSRSITTPNFSRGADHSTMPSVVASIHPNAFVEINGSWFDGSNTAETGAQVRIRRGLIRNCTFRNFGAGQVWLHSTATDGETVLISQFVVENNVVHNTAVLGSVSMESGRFRENRVLGALVVGRNLNMVNVTFEQNTALNKTHPSSMTDTQGDLACVGCVFRNNTNLHSIVVRTGGMATINECVFLNNSRTLRRGSTVLLDGGVANVSNSIFINNSAVFLGGYQGAIAFSNETVAQCVTSMFSTLVQGAKSSATIESSFFSGNEPLAAGAREVSWAREVATAGTETAFGILPFDYCDQNITAGGQEKYFAIWAAKQGGDEHFRGNVVYDETSGYMGILNVTEAGNYDVILTYQHVREQRGGVGALIVRPGAVNAGVSFASGTGLGRVPLYCNHSLAQFIVDLRDSWNNTVEGCQTNVSVQVVEVASGFEAPSVTSCSQGQVYVTYIVQSYGIYDVHVMLDEQFLGNRDPYSVATVYPGLRLPESIASALNSTLTAGQNATVAVSLASVEGAQVCEVVACLEVAFTQAAVSVHASLLQCQERTAIYSANMTTTGLYTLEASYMSQKVRVNSTHDSLVVNAGPALADMSYAFGNFITQRIVQSNKAPTYEIMAQIRDGFGNNASCAHRPVFSLRYPDGQVHPQQIQCDASNSGLWSVVSGVLAPETGLYVCTIALEGHSIQGTPNETLVTPPVCAPGEFGDNGVCEPCPVGQYNPSPVASHCSTCPADTTTADTGSVTMASCVCNLGFYGSFAHHNISCTACPAHATTLHVNSSAVTNCVCEQGYFGNVESPETECYACEDAAACVGGEECAAGYEGFLCLECAKGYFSLMGGVCVGCIESGTWMSLVLFVVVACLIWMFLQADKGLVLNTIHLVAGFYKLTAVFVHLRVPWPNSIIITYAALSVLNLNLDFFFPSCHDIPAWVPWIFTLLIPIFFLLGFGAYVLLRSCTLYCLVRLRTDNRLLREGDSVPLMAAVREPSSEGSENEMQDAGSMVLVQDTQEQEEEQEQEQQRTSPWDFRSLLRSSSSSFVPFTLEFLSFAYVLLNEASLEPFGCSQRSDGVWVMENDPAVQCFAGEWLAFYLPVGILAMLSYSLGIPVLFGWLLWRRRGQAACLVHAFQEDFYYWEVVEKMEEFVLIAIITLTPTPAIQIALVGVAVLISVLLQFRYRPYQRQIYNWMQFTFILLKYLFITSGSMILADPASSSTVDVALAIVLASVSVPAAILIVVSATTLYQHARKPTHHVS